MERSQKPKLEDLLRIAKRKIPGEINSLTEKSFRRITAFGELEIYCQEHKEEIVEALRSIFLDEEDSKTIRGVAICYLSKYSPEEYEFIINSLERSYLKFLSECRAHIPTYEQHLTQGLLSSLEYLGEHAKLALPILERISKNKGVIGEMRDDAGKIADRIKQY